MKLLLLAALLASTSALTLRTMAEPAKKDDKKAEAKKDDKKDDEEKPPKPVAWLKDTLPACPDDKNRTIMDDGKTHIVKFPYVGAVCQL